MLGGLLAGIMARSLVQNVLRPRDVLGGRTVDGQQHAAILHATLIALGFVFGNTCGWRIRKPSRNRSMLFSLKPESSSTPSRWRAEMCC